MFRTSIESLAVSALVGISPANAQSIASVVAGSEFAGQGSPTTQVVISDTDFPMQALLAGDQGNALLNLTTDELGRVAKVEIVQSSGSNSLDQAALTLARERWTFSPAALDKMPIAVEVEWKLPLTQADEYLVEIGRHDQDKITEGPQPLTQHTVTQSDYPAASIRNQEEGWAYIAYAINLDGNVGEMQVVKSSGSIRLDGAARRLVGRWKFVPAQAGQAPAEFWTGAQVEFHYGGGAGRFCSDRPYTSAYERLWQMKDGTTTRGGVWLAVDGQKKVVDALLETKRGWLRVSKPMAEAINFPLNFPPLLRHPGETACWVMMQQ